MDGIGHRHLRDVIQTHFQPATANSWWREKIIAPLVEELVGKLEGQETADLNSQVFARLPLRTVTHGFGLSEAEGLAFRKHVLGTMAYDAPVEKKMELMRAATQILEDAIRERQAEPRDDMISRLVAADLQEEDGSRRKLTVGEVAGFCRLIVFAGGGTTWKQLGITAFALLNHPDQMQAAMADRALLPKAILEGARWYPNDPVFPRQAKRDTVLEGVEIPEGRGDAPVPGRGEPRSRALGKSRPVRPVPSGPALAGFRRRTALVPRPACRARGNARRAQRPVRPFPEHALGRAPPRAQAQRQPDQPRPRAAARADGREDV